MSETFDGYYTPAPTDVPADSRWPWLIVAVGAAIVVAGGVLLSGPTSDHHGNGEQPRTGSASSQQR